MPLPTTPFCTDEDVLLRAAVDYRQLCPRDQSFARGSDGVVSWDGLWTVTSLTVPFASYGVAAGQVCYLSNGRVVGATGNAATVPHFPTGGEAFVVAAASGSSVTLRRKGQAAGVGMPCGPAAGLTAVSFEVMSLGPLLLHASYDMARRLGIDDAFVGRRIADLYDPQELVDATVWTLLARQYAAMSRDAGNKGSGDGSGDDFWAKHAAAKVELDEILARLAVHWKPTVSGVAGPDQSSMRFGRIHRG